MTSSVCHLLVGLDRPPPAERAGVNMSALSHEANLRRPNLATGLIAWPLMSRTMFRRKQLPSCSTSSAEPKSIRSVRIPGRTESNSLPRQSLIPKANSRVSTSQPLPSANPYKTSQCLSLSSLLNPPPPPPPALSTRRTSSTGRTR